MTSVFLYFFNILTYVIHDPGSGFVVISPTGIGLRSIQKLNPMTVGSLLGEAIATFTMLIGFLCVHEFKIMADLNSSPTIPYLLFLEGCTIIDLKTPPILKLIIDNDLLKDGLIIKNEMIRAIINKTEMDFLFLNNKVKLIADENLHSIFSNIIAPENKILKRRIKFYETLTSMPLFPGWLAKLIMAKVSTLPPEANIDALLPFKQRNNRLTPQYRHQFFHNLANSSVGMYSSRPFLFTVDEGQDLTPYYRLMCKWKRSAVFMYTTRWDIYKTKEIREVLGLIPRPAYVKWDETDYHLGLNRKLEYRCDLKTRQAYKAWVVIGKEDKDEFC